MKSSEPICLLPDMLLEDFLIAECNAYGADIWNPWYWDQFGWGPDRDVQQDSSQWQAWVQ